MKIRHGYDYYIRVSFVGAVLVFHPPSAPTCSTTVFFQLVYTDRENWAFGERNKSDDFQNSCKTNVKTSRYMLTKQKQNRKHYSNPS